MSKGRKDVMEVHCKCGAIVFVDDTGGLCEQCPREYNSHGKCINEECCEELTPQQAEDREYIESGRDNFYDPEAQKAYEQFALKQVRGFDYPEQEDEMLEQLEKFD